MGFLGPFLLGLVDTGKIYWMYRCFLSWNYLLLCVYCVFVYIERMFVYMLFWYNNNNYVLEEVAALQCIGL